MIVEEMSGEECRKLVGRAGIARLGCSSQNQPYVVPVFYAYEEEHIYVLSTLGQKIQWMRSNPNVCIEVDEIKDQSHWESVVVNGRYREFADPLDETEISRARRLLSARHQWWLNALAERRTKEEDLSINALFFRIDIVSMSGLRTQSGIKGDAL